MNHVKIEQQFVPFAMDVDGLDDGFPPTAVDVDTTKAKGDKKFYRLLHLDCGMRVLLIHDPALASAAGDGDSDLDDDEEAEDDYSDGDDGEDGSEEGELEHFGKRTSSSAGAKRRRGSRAPDGAGSYGSGSEGDSYFDEEDDGSDSGGGGGSRRGAAGATDAVVAVAVGVGSLADPPELPGLAHFAEHMVFMGSAKYPGENEVRIAAMVPRTM